MMTVESMVEEVGSIGRFQLLVILFNLVPFITAVMSMLFMVFGGVEPQWWCSSRDQHNQSHPSLWWNVTSGNGSGVTPVLSFIDGVSYSIDISTTISSSYSSSSNSSSGGSAGGFEPGSGTQDCEAVNQGDGKCGEIVFTPGMSTIVTEFQLVCDQSFAILLTISLQMAGVLIGAAIAGQLADSVGRKKCLLLFIVLQAVFCFIAAFSVSWHMFAALRVLIGVAVGGLIVACFPYMTEFMGIKWRALVTTIPFWGLGSVLCSLVTWLLPHWFYLHLVIGTIALACLPACLFLPESVRWLTVKGRVQEAHQVLCQMARWNRRQPPSLSSVQALCSRSARAESSRNYSYFHLFNTLHMVKTSCLVGWMWISASMTYYGISFGVKNLSGNFYLNFFLQSLMDTPSSLFVYHLAAKLGRRWTAFAAYVVVSLSLFAVVPITLLLSEDEAGLYVNVMCNVARFSLGMAWPAMHLLHTEMYPTVIRSLATGYFVTISRIGGILAPFLLSVNEPYVFYCLIGGSTALTAVAALLLPETRGQPLRDTLERSTEDYGQERNHESELNVMNP